MGSRLDEKYAALPRYVQARVHVRQHEETQGRRNVELRHLLEMVDTDSYSRKTERVRAGVLARQILSVLVMEALAEIISLAKLMTAESRCSMDRIR